MLSVRLRGERLIVWILVGFLNQGTLFVLVSRVELIKVEGRLGVGSYDCEDETFELLAHMCRT